MKSNLKGKGFSGKKLVNSSKKGTKLSDKQRRTGELSKDEIFVFDIPSLDVKQNTIVEKL